MAVNPTDPIVREAPEQQQVGSPDSIARKRRVAEALLKQGLDYSPIQSWTQGAARVAQALLGAYDEKQLDSQEEAGRKFGNATMEGLYKAFGGNSTGTGASTASSTTSAPTSGNTSQAVNSTLSSNQKALLDTIAGTESPGYNVMYGGKRFDSYADHPRVAVPIGSGPNTGKTSSAAGRYQFLGSTWDAQAKKLGLKDFSPENQDVAAWDLAATTYAQKTGRDLNADLNDPNARGNIGQALSGVWTSLPGGIEAGTNQNRFASAYANNLGHYGNTAVASAAPDAVPLVQQGPTSAQIGDLVQRGAGQGEMMPAVQVASANPNFVPQTPSTAGAQASPFTPASQLKQGNFQPGSLTPAQAKQYADNGFNVPNEAINWGQEAAPAAARPAAVPMPPVDPRAQPQAAPQQVAQAAPPPAPAGGQAVAAALADRGPSVQQLMAASANPWLNDGQRSVINAMLSQKMQAAERANDPLRQLQIQQAQQALAGGTPDEVRMRQIQIQKAERELNTPQKQWQKLDDGTLYDPATGEVKVVGQQGGGMFSGKSVDAQALNWLVQNGNLTQEQAAQLAAGKTITDPQTGAMVFMTPQGIFGQSPGQAPQPLGTQQQGAATPSAPAAQAGTPPSVPGVPGGIALTAGKPVKASESEKNAMTYADRMTAANGILDELGTAGTGLWDQAASNIPLIGNSMVSPEFQRFDQAKRDFINAQLRRESGAAIGQSEFENADKQYFPQRGDSPEVLAQKARNRKTVVEGMIRDAGSTYSRPAEAPAAAPTASQEKAPFPDGTRLRGPDGKAYIVKDGQPVLEQ